MHFRSLIVKGVITGIAMFFPINASAEEEGLTKELVSQSVQVVEAVQTTEVLKHKAQQQPAATTHSEQGEPSATIQLTTQITEETSEKVRMAVKLPVETSEEVRIPAELPLKKSEKVDIAVQMPRATGKEIPVPLQPAIKKTEAAVNRNLPKKMEAEQWNGQGQTNDEDMFNDKKIHPELNEAGDSEERALHTINPGSSAIYPPVKTGGKLDDKSRQPALLKKDARLGKASAVNDSKSEEKGKTSSGQESQLRDTQAVNPQQNPKTPGGSAKDRTGHGQSTPMFSEKWLEQEKHWNVKLIQPYVARAYVYRNQWVNAPPSRPPESPPFFLTSNISESQN